MCTEKAVAFFPSQDTVAAPWWMRNLARGAAKSSGSLLQGCWQMATWGSEYPTKDLWSMPSWIITCRQVKHWGKKRCPTVSVSTDTNLGNTFLGDVLRIRDIRGDMTNPWKNRQENKRRHNEVGKRRDTKRDHLQPAKQLRINFQMPAPHEFLHFSVPTCPAVKSLSWQDGFWVAWKKIRWHHWQSCISSAMAAANSALQSWKKLHKWRTSAARRQIHQVSTSKLQLRLPTRPPFRLSKDTRFRVASRISQIIAHPGPLLQEKPRNLLGKHSQFLKSCKFLATDSQKSYKTSFLCFKGLDSSRPEETRWLLPPRTFLRALAP